MTFAALVASVVGALRRRRFGRFLYKKGKHANHLILLNRYGQFWVDADRFVFWMAKKRLRFWSNAVRVPAVDDQKMEIKWAVIVQNPPPKVASENQPVATRRGMPVYKVNPSI